MVIAGSYIRWLCFRALGRHFTFELALKQGHQLATDGPYGVVRHPSYAGGLLVLSGIPVLVFGPGSWFWECGARDTLLGRMAAMIFVASRMYTLYVVIRRTPVEDAMLEKRFGEEWEAWAERVPWRWVPGVW